MTAAQLIERELRRAERDGVTVEQDPGLQGAGSYLQGYYAGLRMALRLVRRFYRER